MPSVDVIPDSWANISGQNGCFGVAGVLGFGVTGVNGTLVLILKNIFINFQKVAISVNTEHSISCKNEIIKRPNGLNFSLIGKLVRFGCNINVRVLGFIIQ